MVQSLSITMNASIPIIVYRHLGVESHLCARKMPINSFEIKLYNYKEQSCFMQLV